MRVNFYVVSIPRVVWLAVWRGHSRPRLRIYKNQFAQEKDIETASVKFYLVATCRSLRISSTARMAFSNSSSVL